MITKISSNEYLRRVDNMSVAERESYLSRVGEWLEKQAPLLMARANDSVARFQNAIQCSVMWNDDECRAWEDGARLLTAMAGKTDTWLPDMLYVKAAKRSIGQMVSSLTPSPSPARPLDACYQRDARKGEGSRYSQIAQGDSPRVSFRGVGQGNNDGEGEPQNTEAQKVITPLALRRGVGGEAVNQGITPVRPKHIDQYVHLLPEKTQQKAAMVQGLLRDLDKARENARLLMNDPKSKSDSIAQWAKTATALDAKVKAIYKELDAEWEKLVQSGRVVVDALGNARIIEHSVSQKPQGTIVNCQLSTVNSVSADRLKRVEYLKKWLRDTRTKASDERKKQWTKNCKELLKLGGELTDSIRKAAKHYGVDLTQLTVDS